MLGHVVEIPSYALAHLLALAVVLALTPRLYPRDAKGSGAVLDPLLIGIPVGLMGARLLGVWVNGDWPRLEVVTPGALQAMWAGTKWAYGGLLAGTGVGIILVRWRGLDVPRYFDALAPGLAFGAMCARLGCFAAGCCWGVPTDSILGVAFPDDHIGMMQLRPGDPHALHPTQLYLAGAAGTIGMLLLVLRRRGALPRPGAQFLVAAGLYAASVFAVEFFRGDSGRHLGGWLSGSQWISLGIGVLLAISFARRRDRALRPLAACVVGLLAVPLLIARSAMAQPDATTAEDGSVTEENAFGAFETAARLLAAGGEEMGEWVGQLVAFGGGARFGTWARIGRGAEALLAGEALAALGEFTRAAALAPGTSFAAQAEIARGITLLVLRDRAAATEAFRTAATTAEGETLAYAEVGLGQLLAAAGDHEGAERSFRRVLAEQPRAPVADDAAHGLGRSLLRQGRRLEAGAVLAEASKRYERRGMYAGAGRDGTLRWDRLGALGPARGAALLRARATRALDDGDEPLAAILRAIMDCHAGPDLRRLRRRLERAAPHQPAPEATLGVVADRAARVKADSAFGDSGAPARVTGARRAVLPGLAALLAIGGSLLALRRPVQERADSQPTRPPATPMRRPRI